MTHSLFFTICKFLTKYLIQFDVSIILGLRLCDLPFAYFNHPEFYMSPMPSFVGTFKQSGLYLNFSTWLVEKILFEPKNIKL